MKKIFIFILMLSLGTVQGAWNNVRHKHGEMMNMLPENKRLYAPLVGVSLLEGSLGKKIYNEKSKRGEFAKNVLRFLDDRFIKHSVESNPFTTIEVKEIGMLVNAIIDNNLEEFINSDAVIEWHKRHFEKTKRFHKIAKFKNDLKKKLAPLEDMHSQDIAYILAMLLVVVSNSPDDYKVYLDLLRKHHEFDQSDDLGSEQDFFESAVTKILDNKVHDFSKLVPSEQMYGDCKGKKLPICAEQALWGFVNLVLYNKEKKYLDLSVLSNDIQPLPAFKEFIENHSIIEGISYYEDNKQEWINLVSGVPGIDYRDDGCELLTNTTNSIKVLNYLFNINAKTLNECGEILSSTDKEIIINKLEEDYGEFIIKIDYFPIRIIWKFSEGHVSFFLPKEKRTFDDAFVKKIIEYESDNPSKPLAHLIADELLILLFSSKNDFDNMQVKNRKEFIEKIINLPSFDMHNLRYQGKSLLSYAIAEKNYMAFLALVQSGADLNEAIANLSPSDDIPFIDFLIKNGADINKLPTSFYEGLKSKKSAQFLLKNGADVTTHVESLIKGKKIFQARFLYRNMWDENKKIDGRFLKNTLDFYNYMYDVNPIDSDDILTALLMQEYDQLRVLFKKGAELKKIEKEEDVDFIIEELLEKNFDSNVILDQVVCEKFNSKNNYTYYLDMLIKAGISVNDILDKAIEKNNDMSSDVIKYCVEKGATIDKELRSKIEGNNRELREVKGADEDQVI